MIERLGRAQVRLDGLSLPVAVRRLGRVPVIGYFVRVCVGVLRLPNSIQHQNRFEFYTWLQQRTIVEQQNQHHKESSEALQQISAQILAVTQTATEQQRVSELAWAQHGVIEERLAEARTHFDESLSKLTSRFTSLTQEIASTKKIDRIDWSVARRD